MLNLFQHLIKSSAYETPKQVQGDKNGFVQQALIPCLIYSFECTVNLGKFVWVSVREKIGGDKFIHKCRISHKVEVGHL